MANYYLDFVNGNDANDGLGPYKAAYTSGGTTAIAVGDTVTGGTSGQTAKVVYITVTSGSWAGGDAAGSIYVGTPSGAFTAGEALLVSGSDRATLTADFAVSSKKTITTGISAALTNPGDEIRIKKSADPVSLGTATVTHLSTSVVLNSAKWANVSTCESAWTASANVTQSNSTTLKEGSYSQQFVFGSAFTTGKVAYYDFGAGNEKNLSGYTGLSLWFCTSADLVGSMFRIDLCSDASGNTPVDQLTITQKISYDSSGGGWNVIVLDKGSALGSSIRSIALYALSDPGTPTIRLDNIVAVNPGTIHHSAFIGLNDGVWNMPAVLGSDGVTITLAAGWVKSSGTPTLYSAADAVWFEADASTTSINTINESGSSATAFIAYRGGWNFSTDEQDGYTNMLCIAEGCGRMFYLFNKTFVYFENIRIGNCYAGFVVSLCSYNGMKNVALARVTSNPLGSEGAWGYLDGTISLCSTGVVIIAQPYPTQYNMEIAADIYCIKASRAVNGPAFNISGIVHSKGKIYLYNLADVYFGNSQGDLSGYFKYISMEGQDGYGFFGFANSAQIEIDEIEQAGSAPYVVFCTTSATCTVRVGNFNYQTLPSATTSIYHIAGPYTRAAFDALNGDSTRFYTLTGMGYWGDHVTMGKNNDWGYGGTGKSLVIRPGKNTSMGVVTGPTYYKFYIPAIASKSYKLSMQVITYLSFGSDYSGTAMYNVSGCGITPIYNEPVSPTTSWAEHLTSTAFTTTRAGFLCVTLKLYNNASLSQYFGFDDIKLVEQT